jgi:hypothetical protein
VTAALPAAVAELRTTRAIRERCRDVLAAGVRGDLAHFSVQLPRLHAAAQLTAKVTLRRYPDLRVPPHGRLAHFDAGGVLRVAQLQRELADLPPRERARALCDVIITSVLLDAGAGSDWGFHERSGARFTRSEGLAVASLVWMASGALSSRKRPYEVDAAGLESVDEAALSAAFQVTPHNPLVGVAGRVHLLRELGRALRQRSDIFAEAPRPGALLDHLIAQADGARLPAETILTAVLDGLGGIWPGRLQLEGVALGDVWRHPAARGNGPAAGLVPFHKLSQWLSYSLIAPLELAGVTVTDLDALTGLAEYRNGGLFIDSGVLSARDPDAFQQLYDVGSELVVEWRALTVALLDELAPAVRAALGVSEERMPLAAVLEGGTWAAGRELASEKREHGAPPIRIASDGTVF